MISRASVPVHTGNCVIRRIDNECLLIPLTSDIADMDSLYRLNDTGAFIWDAIDGRRSIMELTGMVAQEFDIDEADAEKDIIIFLTEAQTFLTFRDSEPGS